MGQGLDNPEFENSPKADEPTKRRKKPRKPIRPCLIPGNYYFVDDLIEGGIAGKNKFTEWYRKGLKVVNEGSRRLVVKSDAIIKLWEDEGK